MSKAGLTVLLSCILYMVSGVLTQTHAQEKVTAIHTQAPQETVCNTPLGNLFITSRCEAKKTLQVDTVTKGNNKEVEENTLSYSFETATYTPPTPTATPSITVAPSIVPNPMQQAPLDMQGADGSNLNSDLIFDLINAHRSNIGKTPFQKDTALCQLAEARSYELHDELFVKGGLHSGLYNRNLPYWVTEDAKYGSNEAGTVRWWLNSPIHRAAIEGNYAYSCGACQGTKCSQLFTSYTPKIAPAIASKVTVATQ